jgi:uncharacterized protein YdeI (YjbR/CyaY-like superfamily)
MTYVANQTMNVKFFATLAELRRWFRANGSKKTELYVGFYRKDSGRSAVTYPEALDEALCWGWIDGVRKKVDDVSYTNRFTPRKPNSNWSLVNINHVARLTSEGRMQTAGIAAFEARKPDRTGVYSFEQEKVAFDSAASKRFRTNKKAWTFWQSQPPSYRRLATHWVMSAKRAETRDRRLSILIEDSSNGQRLPEASGKKRGT